MKGLSRWAGGDFWTSRYRSFRFHLVYGDVRRIALDTVLTRMSLVRLARRRGGGGAARHQTRWRQGRRRLTSDGATMRGGLVGRVVGGEGAWLVG